MRRKTTKEDFVAYMKGADVSKLREFTKEFIESSIATSEKEPFDGWWLDCIEHQVKNVMAIISMNAYNDFHFFMGLSEMLKRIKKSR